ncbi:MAG TPA: hypothetical protein VEU54_03615 [Steroidobacteraceae bacterium]|jgi:hypothetical protein|nr:hypothetical protein [Steroidobacteraceae bacterium]
MNIRSLQRGLRYCGKVAAVRQTYHVFESESFFLVLSFARARSRRGSGYFNLVDKAAVDYVRQRVGGTRGVTANDVLTRARRTGRVATRLVALNVLYVLVALGQARITRAGEHRQLYFAVRSAPARRTRAR